MPKYTIWISVILLAALLVGSMGQVGRATADGGPVATVTTGALNVRSGPAMSYNVVTSVYRGTLLTLLARNADTSWVKVEVSTGVQGWVNAYYIATAYALTSLPVEEAPPAPVAETPAAPAGAVTATVTAAALNVRTGPGANYARLIAVPRGTTLILTARTLTGSWVKGTLADGTLGWVSTLYVTISQPLATLPIEYPSTTASAPAAQRTHTVQAGENLSRIALRYGVSLDAIARLNNITNTGLIYVGQVLLIP